MKKIFYSALFISTLVFFGCKKAEVIPAPTNSADLKIHFQGVINGSDVEWTKNVNDYSVISKKVLTPNFTTGMLDLAYYCGMSSSTKQSSIEIGLGSLPQDPNLGTSPNMLSFRTFMNNNMMPNYSDTAKIGFEVLYYDENGKFFRSDETQPGTIEFSDYEEKEDDAGEYIQFKAKFTCVVHNWGKTKLTPIQDSILSTTAIQNAILTGYFTR